MEMVYILCICLLVFSFFFCISIIFGNHCYSSVHNLLFCRPDMNSMRSPYQDPTFNTMMRMSTPSQGIYGENGYDAYASTLRRGSTGHEDPAMTMRMSQGQSQASSSVGPLEGTSLPDEEEDEEIYHIDLSN